MCLLDLPVTAIREQAIPELICIAFVGHYAIITALGILIRNRYQDLAAAWYITMALWSFGFRATLFEADLEEG